MIHSKLVPFFEKKRRLKAKTGSKREAPELSALALATNSKNPILLTEALTHPVFQPTPKRKADNQRLEFLGDSILGAILSEELFHLFPQRNEGLLSRNRPYWHAEVSWPN